MDSKTNKSKSEIPKDHQVIMKMFHDTGVTNYDTRCVTEMLQFIHNYTSSVLENAKMISDKEKKKKIDYQDMKKAISNQLKDYPARPPPEELVQKLVSRNFVAPIPAVDSPAIRKHSKKQTQSTLKPQTQSTSKPQTQSTSKPQTQSTLNPQTQSTLKFQTQSTSKPQTQSTSKLQTQSTSKPQTQSTLNPQTQSTLKFQTQSTSKSQTQSTSKLQTQSTSKLQTQSTSKHQTQSTSKPQTQSTLNPQTQSTLIFQTQSTLKPQTQSTLKFQTQSTLKPQTQSTFKPQTQSTLKPQTQSSIGKPTQSTSQAQVKSTLGAQTHKDLSNKKMKYNLNQVIAASPLVLPPHLAAAAAPGTSVLGTPQTKCPMAKAAMKNVHSINISNQGLITSAIIMNAEGSRFTITPMIVKLRDDSDSTATQSESKDKDKN